MAIEPVHRPAQFQPDKTSREWAAAVALESLFLSEMLRQGGLGSSREAFGGGIGEDQFTSLLVQRQADAIVRAGGIGLAESIFRSMSRGMK